MDDLDKTSPLTRFVDMIFYLHTGGYRDDSRVAPISGGHYLGTALCGFFGLELENESTTYGALKGVEGYRVSLEVALEAEKFLVQHSPKRAVNMNLENFRDAAKLLFTLGPMQLAENFADNNSYPGAKMTALSLVANNLSHFDDEATMTNDQINEITDSIDGLIRALRDVPLDVRIKDRMLQTLGSMRTQITRINVVGANDIFDGIDMYIGQLGRAVGTIDDPKQRQNMRGFVDQSIEVMEKIQKVVDFGQKTFPMLAAVTRAIGGG